MPEHQPVRPLDPERLTQVLAAHGVRYVLIGALAARLNGFSRVTADADITPARDRENLERLAAALRALEARVWTDGVPEGLAFDCSAATLSRTDGWNLITSAGRVDVLYRPAGVDGYAELAAEAERFDVFGVSLLVAPLATILRMKMAADRPKDRQDAALIRAILDRDGTASR